MLCASTINAGQSAGLALALADMALNLHVSVSMKHQIFGTATMDGVSRCWNYTQTHTHNLQEVKAEETKCSTKQHTLSLAE